MGTHHEQSGVELILFDHKEQAYSKGWLFFTSVSAPVVNGMEQMIQHNKAPTAYCLNKTQWHEHILYYMVLNGAQLRQCKVLHMARLIRTICAVQPHTQQQTHHVAVSTSWCLGLKCAVTLFTNSLFGTAVSLLDAAWLRMSLYMMVSQQLRRIAHCLCCQPNHWSWSSTPGVLHTRAILLYPCGTQ